MLACPALREGHARRLLDLLGQHDAAAINGYQEGLRSGYLEVRKDLADLVKGPDRLGSILGIPDPKAMKQDVVASAFIRAFEEQVQKHPKSIDEANSRIAEYYRDMLAFNGPIAKWPWKRFDPKRLRMFGAYARVAEILVAPGGGYVMASYQAQAVLAPRAAECLMALWLWKHRSKGPPTDLAAVVKAAGLPGVPIDPYSGEPLRLAIVDGEPVVYSIGDDGRDDGGRLDSNQGRKAGDRIFRLPAVEKPKP